METSEQFLHNEDRSTHAVTWRDRAKYFAAAAGSAGAASLFLGMGDLSLVPAVVMGGIAAYLSPEIRGKLLDRLPTPRATNPNRRAKLAWLLTGETPTSEESDSLDPDRIYALRAMPYAEYLGTPEWQVTRARRLAIDQDACQDCGAHQRLEVHHLTYERLGCERDEDLVTLCRDCHQARHDGAHANEMEALQPRSHALDVAGEDDLQAPVFAPAGPFFFSEVLKMFTPSLDRIYLGTLPDGKPLFVRAYDLCHTALAGATRGGKDHIIRMLMSQLCYAGAKVYLLNPNYTNYDLETLDPYKRPCPEDWTPFLPWLKNDPREMIPRDRKWQVIEHYLAQAYEMVERRLEAYGHSERLGAPQFLFVNEIPAIVEEVPATARYLKKILREGAKVGVFTVNASQDFHVATIFKEIGGGVRKCYRTAYDVGSDRDTQRALGLPIVTSGLGKGKSSLRCDDVTSALRVPYVDNEALYTLLGPSTYTPGEQPQAEDDLASFAESSEREERHTDPALPQQRRHSPVSAYEIHRRRIEQRRQPVYVAAQAREQSAQSEPVSQLRRDEWQVLEAYRAGNKSGMAIKSYLAQQGLPMMGGTRINECLHRLASLGLIDWQPQKR